MIIVRKSIPTTRRQDLETDCELLWVELSLATTKLLIGVFYNPPGSNTNTLIQLRNSLALVNTSSPVVLCGDFNQVLTGVKLVHYHLLPRGNQRCFAT